VRVYPAEAREVAVPLGRLPTGPKQIDDLVQVVDEDAGMSFAGGPEVVLHTEVQLDAPARNHAPPRAARTGGLSISVIPRTPA